MIGGVSVWAPRATQVDVVLFGEDGTARSRRPMVPDEARGEADRPGWWIDQAGEEAGLGAPLLYGFSLDGGTTRPDPRSLSQPFGIDGPSQLVDHESYDWAPAEEQWKGIHLPSSVIYELHIGTFTPEGTFESAIEQLDHVADLGVQAIELCPVAEFSGDRGWGYDGVDLYAPHHAYGGPDGLKRLVEEAHARGLGVILDVVYNHLGPAGNYLGEFGPYFTEVHVTNWGDAVNFSGPGSDEVRRFVTDNAAMWLRDYHMDGLRLDAVHAIFDNRAVHILEELSLQVEQLASQLGRPLFLIAESDLNDPRYVRDRAANGYGLDAAWADEFHHALHAVLTREHTGYYEDFGTIEHLAKACRQAWVYAGDYSAHRQRHHGRPPFGLSASQFVVFIQNHDQVGNRAKGERIAQLAGNDLAKVGAALTLLSPFVPLLFQGEEWAATTPFQYFTAHEDPELGRAVTEGRRDEFADFGWSRGEVPDPQAPETFDRSKLDWAELDKPPHNEMLDWYRSLTRLRHAEQDVRIQDLLALTAYDEEQRWLTIARGNLFICANFGSAETAAPLPESNPDPAAWSLLLASAQPSLDKGVVRLPGRSVAILSKATDEV